MRDRNCGALTNNHCFISLIAEDGFGAGRDDDAGLEDDEAEEAELEDESDEESGSEESEESEDEDEADEEEGSESDEEEEEESEFQKEVSYICGLLRRHRNAYNMR